MGYEAYRVRKSFGWDGWMFAPSGRCKCFCDQPVYGTDQRTGNKILLTPAFICTGQTGTNCDCHDSACHCDCGIRVEQYAGDIWLVEEGNVRKGRMIANRFATYDSSIPPINELMDQDFYKEITMPREYAKSEPKQRGRKAAVEA